MAARDLKYRVSDAANGGRKRLKALAAAADRRQLPQGGNAWKGFRLTGSGPRPALPATSVGTPARLPLSASAFFTHSFSVCAEQPIFAETGLIAYGGCHDPDKAAGYR
ncbi:hypothetical protein [Leisingera sp. M658]|uniref:hypothetical protein n=1 Tax=Leisingera sp. M658 TaxID=2867015 RepID=UPI0021A4F4A1|nr:hypothetical protein [Leisingera sp. M658]UWQ77512.1 hypothetical protein K3724_23620 [Leisingera sp. M658]